MAIRRAKDGSGMVVSDITTTDGLSENLGALVVTAFNSAGTEGSYVQGNVAAQTADSGNPVKVGGVYMSQPTLIAGQRGDLMLGLRGALRVQLTAPNATADITSGVTNVDGVAVSAAAAAIDTRAYGYLFNGASFDRARGDANGVVVQSALSSTFWSYAAPSGGITNSATAVAAKAAGGAGVRNYVQSAQISHDALGAATDFAILDGATVIWRGRLQTGATDASGQTINFDPPLKGTANTAVNIQSVTAVTGAILCNLQGFTGT